MTKVTGTGVQRRTVGRPLVLIMALIGLVMPNAAQAQAEPERLGLHVSTTELEVWRARASHGPYRVAGDAIANSPGDWDRIAEQSRKFMADPDRYVWAGPTHNYPAAIKNSRKWPRDLTGMPGTGNKVGAAEPIRDAAFFAMVLGAEQVPRPTLSSSDRDVILGTVKDAILQMVRSPYNDFSNRSRFDPANVGTGFHPSFQMSGWLTKLVFAFDYSQVANPALWSAGERAEFVTWLNEGADWFIAIVESRRDDMFNADGSVTEAGDRPFATNEPLWAGGPESEKVHHRMDNHVPRLVRIPVWAGLLAELEQSRAGVTTISAERTSQLVAYGYRQVNDYLVAEFIPQAEGTGRGIASAGGNFYRGITDTGPLDGWKYAIEHLGSNLVIADHIARAGDPGIYEMATTMGTSLSAGLLPDDGLTNGGPKTFRGAIRQLLRYIDERNGVERYGCLNCNNDASRIDSRDDRNQIYRTNEWEVLHANVYFQDDYTRSIYMRARPGTPPLPKEPRNAQGWITGGDHGIYPGVNFMFAQTEGLVWPYPHDGKTRPDNEVPSVTAPTENSNGQRSSGPGPGANLSNDEPPTQSTEGADPPSDQPAQEAVVTFPDVAGDPVVGSVTVSQSLFAEAGTSSSIPSTSGTQAGAVVLTRADEYADGLAGTPLAAEHSAPLLLTGRDALASVVAEEIKRVLEPGSTVFLLGGHAALGPAVEAQVEAMGMTTQRLAGSTRFETAVAIAEHLSEPSTVIFTRAFEPVDALAAGAAAARVGGAVLLTDESVAHPVTQAYVDSASPTSRYAAGGPAAAAHPEAIPLVGETRFETAALLGATLFDTAATAAIAPGFSTTDAVIAGAYIGVLGGPLLLTTEQELHPSTDQQLRRLANTVDRILVFDLSSQVATDVLEQARVAIQ